MSLDRSRNARGRTCLTDMRIARVPVLILLLLLGAAVRPAAAGTDPKVVLQLADYVAVDYPSAVADGAVVNAAEYAEMREFAARIVELAGELGASPELMESARRLVVLIDARASADEVAATSRAIRDGVLAEHPVELTPGGAPDLRMGAALYRRECASCHGPEGRGDGPLAAGMDPPPVDFVDRGRAMERSLYGLYNTITLGVEGTSMRGYAELSEAERWALAFYVGGLVATDADLAAGARAVESAGGTSGMDVRTAVASTPTEIGRDLGADAAALALYARRHPGVLFAAARSPYEVARQETERAVASFRSGDRAAASAAALSAYLDGFELVESSLAAMDAGLMRRVESDMMALRQVIGSSDATAADVERRGARVLDGLAEAEALASGSSLTPAVTFASSLVILLREGLEAILVLAAIAAFLVRTGRRDAFRYLHAGWIGALALGVATWAASVWLLDISGATRELTEGLTALFAAVMLFYVGFWMHRKMNAQRWSAFLREHVGKALEGGTLWTLALVSFLAVYREVFETVLFYQALWAQSSAGGGTAVLAGAGTAALLLVVASWLIFRLGVRLPLKQFFGVSAAVMIVLAVILAGKGVAALQEAGSLSASPVNFLPRIDLLGIYPNWQVLAVQIGLVAAAIALVVYNRRSEPAAG